MHETEGMGVWTAARTLRSATAPDWGRLARSECQSDHAFGGAHGFDNGNHPLSPPGSLWRCLADSQ